MISCYFRLSYSDVYQLEMDMSGSNSAMMNYPVRFWLKLNDIEFLYVVFQHQNCLKGVKWLGLMSYSSLLNPSHVKKSVDRPKKAFWWPTSLQ